jgi:hypothetical protein
MLPLLAALVLGCGLMGLAPGTVVGADDPDTDAGRRMYRDGIRPSGEPMTALVAGDVPLLGTQFSCQNCHGRSGMGGSEGPYIVPATAGQILFAPSPQPKRPAYDRSSLSRVLRDGVDPAGRVLGPLMPRYPLADNEMQALADYLAGLSSVNSPGVDDKTIRFATVITEGVDPAQREAVMTVLRAFVDEKNRQTRLEGQRPDRGSTPASRLPTVYREWVLDEWMLTGPSESWGMQLEARYGKAPVFAMLGGLSSGSWGEISRFCEKHEIPCLFPGIDLPDAGQDDFYTLYFSRGLKLEADLVAEQLLAQATSSVVQLSCGAGPAGVAEYLGSTLKLKGVKVEDIVLDCEAPLPASELASRMAGAPDSAAVLWLDRDQLSQLEGALPAGSIYLSSTLLELGLGILPISSPGRVFLAHPFRLPDETDAALARFTVWAKVRSIEVSHPRLQSGAFFACIATKDIIAHMGRFFIRDYFLDTLDHAQGLVPYIPIHPRPTFGPGQRFLTKGGYLLPVQNGRADTKGAAWILPRRFDYAGAL